MQTAWLRRIAAFALAVAGLIVALASPSNAGWLIYHKPAFEGRIVDAETGQPLEGAVVMAVYHKRVYSIAESDTDRIHIHETLTDKEGRFHIPSYSTVISPFSTGDYVGFTIYKKGYVFISHKPLEKAFTNRPPDDPEIGPYKGGRMVKVTPGTVALPKLDNPEDTREDARFLLADIPHGTLMEKTILQEMNQ